MITSHVLKRLGERHIEIDIEMVEYLSSKYSDVDTAVIIGSIEFLGDKNYIILIIRDGNAVTIEFRRCSQKCDKNSLNVDEVITYPCIF